MQKKYCRARQAIDGYIDSTCTFHAGYLQLQTHTANV